MYVVMELQTSTSGIAIVPPTTHATREEAEARFHAVLSAAAVSSVPVHTAVMLDEEGYPVRPPECYKHTPAPAPKPEPEPEPEEPEETDEP